ncbi:MAG: sugar phosphate isomerase/epimerase family protein [Kiritimatiellia bacterium]|jgi:L-ribulose-5-phosphate 3-epimerase
MKSFKIGVIVDSFRLPPREGVLAAKAVGAEGIQIYGGSKTFAPELLDKTARRDFRKLLDDQDLVLSALCGDIGNFMDPAKNPERIARSKTIVDLAVDLGTTVVTTHIGSIPNDASSSIYKMLLDVCRDLGDYATAKGVSFAIETGPETARSLRDFLDTLGVPGVGVNLDPANLVMVCRDDPVAAVDTLAPYIVHTHAKDGRNLKPCNPEEVYAAFVDGTYPDLEKALGGVPFVELPLGEGDVDWKPYLAALAAIGYNGFLTIEREEGDDRYGDIAKGVEFLRSLIK